MNIILSDREETLINIILKYTNWNISLLIIDDVSRNIEKYKGETRIEKTMTLSEIMNYGIGKNFSYHDAEKYKYTFSACDYGSRRIMDDYNYSHYQYYQGVGFWRGFFENNDIDICLITNLYHGFICDYLLQEMAIDFKVECFNVFYHGFNTLAVFYANKHSLVKIKTKPDMESQQLEDMAFYAKKFNPDKPSSNKTSLKYKIVYKIGGIFLVRFLTLIMRGPFDIHYNNCSWYSYFKAYYKLKSTLKRNKKIYEVYDKNENYIIYFLHLEPEAVIVNYGTEVDSQLVAIETLSLSAPKGWKIYVKEHPDIYRLNKLAFEHYLPCAYTFLTPYFYNFISKLKNVSLIDYRIPATDIIKNAKAVSTIAGTVSSEAILNKKPLILFGNEKLLYNFDKNFIFVKSVKDCISALKKIEKGYQPDYKKYKEVMNQYLVNADSKSRIMIIKCINKIIEDMDFHITKGDK